MVQRIFHYYQLKSSRETLWNVRGSSIKQEMAAVVAKQNFLGWWDSDWQMTQWFSGYGIHPGCMRHWVWLPPKAKTFQSFDFEVFQRIFNYYQIKVFETHCETWGDPLSNNRWLQWFIKKIPLDGGKVIDKCINGLAVRVLTLYVRGIGFDSHPRLKLFSHLSLRCSKE